MTDTRHSAPSPTYTVTLPPLSSSVLIAPAFDDGRTQLLLCLHGLLPISFRGTAYNIPIAVWLTLDYPRRPPLVYVVPTNDMLVRAGPHVDPSGLCSIEYMRFWERKPEVCFLAAACVYLCAGRRSRLTSRRTPTTVLQRASRLCQAGRPSSGSRPARWASPSPPAATTTSATSASAPAGTGRTAKLA